MKFRLLVRIAETLLKMGKSGDEPRADMYLPEFLLAFGAILIAIGIGFGIGFAFKLAVWMLIVALAGVLLGVAAVMCWRNQTIRVISDEIFVYTTFLGNKKEYRFADITALRKNSDSLTLYVGKGKVHIESMAIMSDRLVLLIDAALKNN